MLSRELPKSSKHGIDSAPSYGQIGYTDPRFLPHKLHIILCRHGVDVVADLPRVSDYRHARQDSYGLSGDVEYSECALHSIECVIKI